MPLGGYCTICQRWVWLTPYGECEYGHSATVVRDAQLLSPAKRRDAVVEAQGEAPVGARFRWWWRHSLWIAWTFTAGFLNWVAFMYIGVRARHLPWSLLGFVYLMPLALTIATIHTAFFTLFVALQLFVSAGSVLHALYLRPYYRAAMFGDLPRRILPAPPQPPELEAPERPQLPDGIDAAAAEVILEARDRVDAIGTTAAYIAKPAVRDKVAALCDTAEEILAELVAKPRKVGAARSFLTYYLDAAARIVEGYANLSRRAAASPDVARALARAEQSLESLQEAFDRQLSNVLEDRVLDLESEIELLEKTVRMDAMYSRPGGQ
jgi:hypothetical protein